MRVIDAYADTLDLATLSFTQASAAATGRSGHRPGDLLKLRIYGDLNQIRSSPRLEREAVRNIEVLWLIGRLSPSFKTLADFRQDHPAAIVGACRIFSQGAARHAWRTRKRRPRGAACSVLVDRDGSEFLNISNLCRNALYHRRWISVSSGADGHSFTNSQ